MRAAREATTELLALRLQRTEALRPALLCRHRARLKEVAAREAFLRQAVGFAESLQQRKLVQRVEAEAPLRRRGARSRHRGVHPRSVGRAPRKIRGSAV